MWELLQLLSQGNWEVVSHVDEADLMDVTDQLFDNEWQSSPNVQGFCGDSCNVGPIP